MNNKKLNYKKTYLKAIILCFEIIFEFRFKRFPAPWSETEYPLDEDWTEVVIFGNHADQDTVADPYYGDPTQNRQWITTV